MKLIDAALITDRATLVLDKCKELNPTAVFIVAKLPNGEFCASWSGRVNELATASAVLQAEFAQAWNAPLEENL